MFKLLPLIWASLGRKRLRTWLTIASISIAFVLFGVLQTLRVAMTGTPEMGGADRMMTTHKMSLILSMPQSYLTRIRSVPGLKVACSHNWFGGIYQEDRNQLPVFAVDSTTFFETYPEIELSAAAKQDFLRDRASAIVSENFAEQFNWKVGDTIPMRSNIFQQSDGNDVWDLKIAGIFTQSVGANQAVYMHYEYLNEARSIARDEIGWVVSRVSDPKNLESVARAIDALFANSSTETKTSSERAFMQAFANQLGDVGKIVSAIAAAVFFSILLVTANTMAESIRERTSELGVMKTLGFSSRSVILLVVGEALLLTLLGAVIGLAIATPLSTGIGKAVENFFPSLGMPAGTYAIGFAIAVVLALLCSILPGVRAWRLQIVDALRKV